jgi:trigger factor
MPDELVPATEKSQESPQVVTEGMEVHEHDHDHEGHEHEVAAEQPPPKEKLNQIVDIRDIGPCKKYVKVSVNRDDVDRMIDAQIDDLEAEAVVPGFRPGKAPRAIVIRKFRKEVHDQVRMNLLMASLEQLGEEQKLAPLSMPDLDPATLEIPNSGPFVYEFEVEVRPEFDLPNYRGLKIKRPVRTFTDKDVEQEKRRLLADYSQLVPKPEGDAQVGDYLTVDMTSKHGDRDIGTLKEVLIRIDDTLAFKDGVARKFGEQVLGASAGDTRVIDIEMTDAVADPSLRGQTVQGTLAINDVKKLRFPELTHEFLHKFGLHNVEQFNEKIYVLLEKRLEYEQRQSARTQILEQLTKGATWDLPSDLLQRQASRAFERRVLEMREMGISEDEIKARQRLLQRDVLRSTARSLEEHFVLQKIAELEKIDIDEDTLDAEIENLAEARGESPRRLRAQLEREDLMESIANQLVERLALNLILSSAEIEDETIGAEAGLAAIDQQAVPGEIQDPTAAPEEEMES